MSVGATDAVARVSAIQQMVSQLQAGSAGAGFDAALQAAQSTGAIQASATSVSGVPYAAEINAAATKYGIDPSLLAGLVKQESGFNPTIRSGAGAVGLTQLMPATARGLGVTDPTDPAQSLEGGAKYLRQQLDRFGGDARLALAAYNAGPGAVQRYGGVPPYSETQHYVEAVLSNRDSYAAAGFGRSASAATLPGAASISSLPQTQSGTQLLTSISSPSTSGQTSTSSSLSYPTT